MSTVVLVLGGTGEARQLAGALAGAAPSAPDAPGASGAADNAGAAASDMPSGGRFVVISSLAGRTSTPLLPPGEVRIGGFGGAAGLAGFLRDRRVDVVVDATHPFAERISANAAAATREVSVPLLVLRRPGWIERAGDDWHRVGSLAQAAALVPDLGRRVFLTIGRQGLAAFAEVDGCMFLARSVEPPRPPVPKRLTVMLDRGPFTLDGERALLRDHRIDVVVSKDSGGHAPKLAAARVSGVPVVLVDRPAATAATATVETVPAAMAWLLGAESLYNRQTSI